MAGNGSRAGATRSAGGLKVSPAQRAIATEMKKAVASKNVQATRILQKMAARDGHGGDIRSLTQTGQLNLNKWSALPLNRQRGNAMSAERSRDMQFNRGPSRRLVRATMAAADAGFISQRRLDAVLNASGVDYFSVNKGYWRAVDRARAKQGQRRRATA